VSPPQQKPLGVYGEDTQKWTPDNQRILARVREVLYLGGCLGFGSMGADVYDPVADDCQEAVEAAGGQLA
jgi:hypothetical protein